MCIWTDQAIIGVLVVLLCLSPVAGRLFDVFNFGCSIFRLVTWVLNRTLFLLIACRGVAALHVAFKLNLFVNNHRLANIWFPMLLTASPRYNGEAVRSSKENILIASGWMKIIYLTHKIYYVKLISYCHLYSYSVFLYIHNQLYMKSLQSPTSSCSKYCLAPAYVLVPC